MQISTELFEEQFLQRITKNLEESKLPVKVIQALINTIEEKGSVRIHRDLIIFQVLCDEFTGAFLKEYLTGFDSKEYKNLFFTARKILY